MALENEDYTRNVKRDNTYNEINRDTGSDKFDIDLPLYLVNQLNQNGFKTTGDLGFYIDLCQGKTKEEVDEYITNLNSTVNSLNMEKQEKEKLNSNKTISKDMLKVVNSINDIVQIMSSSSGAYNPYKDVTGVNGNTDFINDINELKRLLNSTAFDPEVKKDIALREKRIKTLKEEIAKERAEIKSLSATADNLEEITRRAANFNRLAQSYHNAERSLEKRKNLYRAEKGLLSYESINKALNLVDKIYSSLNYASLNGYNNPKIKELNRAFAKLKNTLNEQRNYLDDDKKIDANIENLSANLSALAEKLKVEVASSSYTADNESEIEQRTSKEPPKPQRQTSKTSASDSAFNQAQDRYKVGDKVLFIGINESDNVNYYNNVNIFSAYTIASIDDDGYTFKEVNGKYHKENFASEEDFKRNYERGKEVYLYINKDDVDLVPEELSFNKPYKIKNIYGNKLEFFGLKDTYPINTFIPKKTWNKVGYDITGLMPSQSDFDAKFAEAYGLNSKKELNANNSKLDENKYVGLVYVGLLKNMMTSYIPGFSFGSLYKTLPVSGNPDKVTIEGMDGEYNKDAFMTPLEFNKTYLAGMKDGEKVIFTPKLSRMYDEKLVAEREYIIEKYDPEKKTVKLLGIDGEFDAKSFFPCYWKYLTGKTINPEKAKNPEKSKDNKEELVPGVKVIYHGVSNNNELGNFENLSMLETYTIKAVNGDTLEFEEVEGTYPKEYFATFKEFLNDTKEVYYFPTSPDAEFNESLSLTTPYTIKKVKDGKCFFYEIEGEYDFDDFIPRKDWVRAASSLTGLSVNDADFAEVLRDKISGRFNKYVVYNGKKIEGFDLCYADLEVGKQYKVIKETAGTYTIDTGNGTQIIGKTSFDTLEKWQEKENLVVYTGRVTRDLPIDIFKKLQSGKAYKVRSVDDDFVYLSDFSVKFPKKCFMPYLEWSALTDEEKKNVIAKNTPHKEVSRHVVKTTAYTALAAGALLGLTLMLLGTGTRVAAGKIMILVSAIVASVDYSIDKLTKKGKKKESLKIKKMIKNKYSTIKEKINDFKENYLYDDEELESTIDEVFNNLAGDDVEEALEDEKDNNKEAERIITK